MALKPTWKSVERAIAKLLGGERVPVSGRQRGSAPDIAHESLSLEVKHRESLPSWLHQAMNQAEMSQKTSKQIPAVILHQKGMRYENCFSVIRLSDLIKLLEGGDLLRSFGQKSVTE